MCVIPVCGSAAEPSWLTDYRAAYHEAKAAKKMLAIHFEAPDDAASARFAEVLADPTLAEKLAACVCLRLPVTASTRSEGAEVTLLAHRAFRAMDGRPGLALLDMVHEGTPYYGWLVSALPCSKNACYSAEQVAVALGLPEGSRLQRLSWFAERLCVAGLRLEPAITQLDARPRWLTDYGRAYAEAERMGKMLLIYFHDNGSSSPCSRFEQQTLGDAKVIEKLADYVCLRLPVNATIISGGKQIELLKQTSFSEMLGRPGIAVVDLANKGRKHYGTVVSTFPLGGRLYYGPREMAVILTLPPGTLTQRTLIYAVRTHPEAPASASGEISGQLLNEAESHSQYQANIRVQGHHRWETRFHRINRFLPGGCSASEVCAESWPGETLVEAAIECVRCWRLSSGHWSAVRARQRVYGYDMKRGGNGIWYATGIFGR